MHRTAPCSKNCLVPTPRVLRLRNLQGNESELLLYETGITITSIMLSEGSRSEKTTLNHIKYRNRWNYSAVIKVRIVVNFGLAAMREIYGILVMFSFLIWWELPGYIYILEEYIWNKSDYLVCVYVYFVFSLISLFIYWLRNMTLDRSAVFMTIDSDIYRLWNHTLNVLQDRNKYPCNCTFWFPYFYLIFF